MPKLPKSWRPEPTKEEVFRDTWAATNKIIRKAMIDRDVRHDKDLAEQIGLSKDLFSKRMTMKVPWSYQDLCLVVSALNIPGEDAMRMLGVRR